MRGTRGWVGVDYTERLRCLAINDARFAEGVGQDTESQDLSPKTLALVRLAALVAVGAPFRPTGRRPMPQ